MRTLAILAVMVLASCVVPPPPDPMVACGDYGSLRQSKCREERERDARFAREENARRQAKAEQERHDFERTQAEIQAHKQAAADAAAARAVADAEAQRQADEQEEAIEARNAEEQRKGDAERASEEKRIAVLKRKCGAAYNQPPRAGQRFESWRRCWATAADVKLAGQGPYRGKTVDLYRVAGTWHVVYVLDGVILAWE